MNVQYFVNVSYELRSNNKIIVLYCIVLYDHTCNNTFAGIRNVIDDVRNDNVNFHWKYVHFTLVKAIITYFRSHMIKRILHSWSFHMKFIKLAEGSFNKFHMK